MEFSLNHNEIEISASNLGKLFQNEQIQEAAYESSQLEDFEYAGYLYDCLTSEEAKKEILEVDGLGVSDADIVFTFRNYHNFDAAGRAAMNKAAYDALKIGGTYAVVDHTRRHMEADNPENRRRLDPVLAIKEIQQAGFELVDFSDLHFRPDDELRYEVGRKTVTGNTDRWTLKFVKK